MRTSGFWHPGLGAATYVLDLTLNAEFVARHPKAAFIAKDGRIFRIDGAYIAPEQFGALGNGQTNDQSAIQAAIDFAEASTHVRTLTFASAEYAIWAPHRHEPYRHPLSEAGVSLVVRRGLTFLSTAACGTRLLYRNSDGREFDQHWQLTSDGKVWRGPGLLLRGYPSWNPLLKRSQRPPSDFELPSIKLVGISLDGGADRGPDVPGVFPADPTTGNGWDITHKGVHCEEDTYCGKVILVNSEIVRFRGELIYHGGIHSGDIIAINSRFAETNADLINPCPGHRSSLSLIGCTFENGYQGFEGWGGRTGQIKDCLFRNCYQGAGRLQGGISSSGQGASFYYRPTASINGESPWLTLSGVKFEQCGRVMVGSWVRGDIHLVDTTLAIQTFGEPDEIFSIDLDVYALVDRRSDLVALNLSSSDVPGSCSVRDVRIRLSGEQSNSARAEGRVFDRMVTYTGSYGPEVVIIGTTGVTRRYSTDLHQTRDSVDRISPDSKPCFLPNNWTCVGLDWSGCETDVTFVPVISFSGDHHKIIRSDSGSESASLATHGYQDGHTVTCYIGAGFESGLDLYADNRLLFADEVRHLRTGSCFRLRFDGETQEWKRIA